MKQARVSPWLVTVIALCAAAGGFGVVRLLAGAGHPEMAARAIQLDIVAPGADSTVRFEPGPLPTMILVFDEACPHCATQAPAWQRVAERFAGTIRSVSISLSSPDGSDAHGLFSPGAIEYLGAGFAHQLRGAFALRGVPFTALVSPEGRLLARAQGLRTEGQLQDLLEKLRP